MINDINFEKAQELYKIGFYTEAIKIFNTILKKDINNIDVLFSLGKIYFALNNIQKSVFYLRKCNQIKNKNPIILLNLALSLQSLGKMKEAEKYYRSIIKFAPSTIRAYYGLFTLDINNIDDTLLIKLIELNKNNKLSLGEKSLINYIFSKIEKNKGNINNEIKLLNTAHVQSYNSNSLSNNQSDFYFQKIISSFFNKKNLTNSYKKKDKFNNSKFIFIIGLPRSGSTFVEALISQNSSPTKTFGEFHAFNMSIFDQVASTIYSKDFNLEKFSFNLDKKKFQDSLLERYGDINEEIIIDKSLENFFNIDLILEFFPNAKFLHTFRDYNDSIIGIYQSMISELSWCHEIKSIVNYIKIYKKVIDFYKKKYPNKILDVNLKMLTNDKETEAKKIFSFCNIQWDKKILNFYQNKNLFSKTASFNQIRKNIEKYNLNQYKPYYHLIDTNNNIKE